jgi:hypothetical protein
MVHFKCRRNWKSITYLATVGLSISDLDAQSPAHVAFIPFCFKITLVAKTLSISVGGHVWFV